MTDKEHYDFCKERVQMFMEMMERVYGKFKKE